MKVNSGIARFIFILLILYLIYLSIEYIAKPVSEFAKLRNEYNQICMNYNYIHQNLIMNEYYNNKEKELLAKKYNLNILPYLKQEEIIKILHKYLSECDIIVTKLKFSEISPALLDNSIDESNTETDENDVPSISLINVKIEFNSTYDNMVKLIDKFQSNPIDISITNTQATLSEGNIVFVVMDINFYSLTEYMANNF